MMLMMMLMMMLLMMRRKKEEEEKKDILHKKSDNLNLNGGEQYVDFNQGFTKGLLYAA